VFEAWGNKHAPHDGPVRFKPSLQIALTVANDLGRELKVRKAAGASPKAEGAPFDL